MASEFLVFFILMPIAGVSAHPMCLNYEPPLARREGEYELCRGFERWGCCNKQRDSEIHLRYEDIMERMPLSDQDKCSDVVRDLLCQECSSYSDHMFGLEKHDVVSSLPGLCKDYCFKVFRNCSRAIGYLTDDQIVLEFIRQDDVEGFCNAIRLPDDHYCYPLEYLQYYEIPNEKPCVHLCVEEVANRLYNPVSIRNAGDSTHRLFVIEQRGVIWVFLPNMSRVHPPFLNKTSEVVCNLDAFDERGFLDIQFHPEYLRNGLFYIYYSTSRDSQDIVRISEMKVSSTDRNRADPNSERVILEIEQPYKNHNGGQLLFGEDGYLYIFTGDGGSGGDPHGNSQNRSSLLGKVLRLDVTPGGDKPYSAPSDNPFVSLDSAAPEIFAYGMRNPWRCAFDLKGRIICGDVGQDEHEEIDIIEKGGNYGWAAYEGDNCFDQELCKTTQIVETHISPIYSYNHSFGGSITGGLVYKGCQNPKLRGKYIYGDFMSGRMALLRERKSGKWENRNVCMMKNACSRQGKGHKYARYVLTFGEDESGEIYVGSTSSAKIGHRGGRIYKFSHAYKTRTASECKPSGIETMVLSPGSWLEPYTEIPARKVEFRLIGALRQTPIVTKGRVEIRPIGQKWSTICGRAWNLKNAHVICRMMGFSNAREGTVGEYGSGRGRVRFERLNCRGDEDHIDECDHSGWQPTACPHAEDASIWCESSAFK